MSCNVWCCDVWKCKYRNWWRPPPQSAGERERWEMRSRAARLGSPEGREADSCRYTNDKVDISQAGCLLSSRHHQSDPLSLVEVRRGSALIGWDHDVSDAIKTQLKAPGIRNIMILDFYWTTLVMVIMSLCHCHMSFIYIFMTRP